LAHVWSVDCTRAKGQLHIHQRPSCEALFPGAALSLPGAGSLFLMGPGVIHPWWAGPEPCWCGRAPAAGRAPVAGGAGISGFGGAGVVAGSGSRPAQTLKRSGLAIQPVIRTAIRPAVQPVARRRGSFPLGSFPLGRFPLVPLVAHPVVAATEQPAVLLGGVPTLAPGWMWSIWHREATTSQVGGHRSGPAPRWPPGGPVNSRAVGAISVLPWG